MVIFLKYNIKIRGAVDALIGIFLGGWEMGGMLDLWVSYESLCLSFMPTGRFIALGGAIMKLIKQNWKEILFWGSLLGLTFVI